MRKGFGFYSPHETTVFFLKSLLLSFWAGLDLVAALVISASPAGSLARHGFLYLFTIAFLIAGSVLSILFVWATGSLFAKQTTPTKNGTMAMALHNLKRQPRHLMIAGIACASIFFIPTAVHFRTLQKEDGAMLRVGRADAQIARKCSEVASLEGQLFHSDEQAILAECLIQYAEKYAPLRNASRQDQPRG